jgi:hypothetical protein
MNPYLRYPDKSFWKRSKAKDKLIENLWVPKFKIIKNDLIITLGSCFAQHISKWLIINNYNWMNYETDSTTEDFSFGTGNIYTAAQLKLWIQLAFDEENKDHEYILDKERFYDVLKPNGESNGFKNLEELLGSRKKTEQAIKKGFLQSDLFIFTLGLTEGWMNINGTPYPVCPGTIKGEYNENEHIFINYTYEEILKDMIYCIEKINSINHKIKIIITVSPVPLVATATQNHVLSATVYSKSVLRVVCEKLKEKYDYVDYFPSFEIISTHALNQINYEVDLRTVKNESVNIVMKHFSQAINKNSNYLEISNIDEFCDELMLDSPVIKKQKYEICIIGDSHMEYLLNAFNKYEINAVGGMIMNGSAWNNNDFKIDEDEFFVPLENSKSRAKYSQIFPFINDEYCKIIITNISMHTHKSVFQLVSWLKENKINELNSEVFNRFVSEKHILKIKLLNQFLMKNLKVLIITVSSGHSLLI